MSLPGLRKGEDEVNLGFKCLYYVEKRKNIIDMQKYIVVTGGTKGIGRAIIERFAADGFHIITCARHQKDLQQLKLDIEQQYTFSKVFFLATDVGQEGEVQRFLDYIKSLKVKVDVLVNNAGFFIPGKIHEESDTVLREMINTNLYSAYDLTKGLVPDMVKRRDGHISPSAPPPVSPRIPTADRTASRSTPCMA
jgi:short-subunit dehydrogenase